MQPSKVLRPRVDTHTHTHDTHTTRTRTRLRRPAPPPGAPIPPISRLVRPRPSPPSSAAAALYRSLSLHRPSPLRVVHTRRFVVAAPAHRPPPPVLLRAPLCRRSSRRASSGLGLAVHPLLPRSLSCGSSSPYLRRRLDSSSLGSHARPPFCSCIGSHARLSRSFQRFLQLTTSSRRSGSAHRIDAGDAAIGGSLNFERSPFDPSCGENSGVSARGEPSKW